jgi:hypothetical protein
MYDVVATSKITVGSGSSLTVTGKGRREQWCVKADLGPPDLAIIDERGRRLMTTRVLTLIMHVQFRELQYPVFHTRGDARLHA